MEIKKDTHVVLKKDWVYERLTKEELESFINLYNKIVAGREYEYIICNKDEPYARAVWEIILEGEKKKEGSNGVS